MSTSIKAKAGLLRERCLAAYREGKEYEKEDPDFDAGDSKVDIDGRGYNVLTVLDILASIGVPDCHV